MTSLCRLIRRKFQLLNQLTVMKLAMDVVPMEAAI